MKQITDVKEIIGIQVDILKAFADYCDAHDIRYYLTGGTLLGAIRHKGVIPWDDDVDVMMPRTDYNKLLEVSKGKISQYYSVSVLENNKAHSRLFMRIVDDRVTYCHQYYQDKYHMGFGIDVFPIDDIPEDEAQRNKYFRKIRFWKKQFSLAQSAWFKSTSKSRAIAKAFASIPARIMGRDFAYKKVMSVVKKYENPDSKYVGISTGVYLEKEVSKREEFLPYVEVEFEGRMYHAPQCYDKYLKQLYGDYMQLPPEEDRKRKHAFDLYWK